MTSLWMLTMDMGGNVTGRPYDDEIAKKIGNHLEEMTGTYDHTFFVQGNDDRQEFAKRLSDNDRMALCHGCAIIVRADNWEMAHYYGYDTYTLFEDSKAPVNMTMTTK